MRRPKVDLVGILSERTGEPEEDIRRELSSSMLKPTQKQKENAARKERRIRAFKRLFNITLITGLLTYASYSTLDSLHTYQTYPPQQTTEQVYQDYNQNH